MYFDRDYHFADFGFAFVRDKNEEVFQSGICADNKIFSYIGGDKSAVANKRYNLIAVSVLTRNISARSSGGVA